MTSLKKSLFNLLASFTLVVVSLYFPLFFFIYFPRYHLSELPKIKRIEIIGQDKAKKAVAELYGFFRYENNLTMKEWSEKELKHLEEVRRLFYLLGFLFLLSIIFLIAARKQINISGISFWNGLGLLFSGMLLSVHFVFFWKHIFHPLLFENSFWRNTPADLSYYLMPRSFFKKVTLWICLFSLVFHFLLCLFFFFKKRLQSRIPLRTVIPLP